MSLVRQRPTTVGERRLRQEHLHLGCVDRRGAKPKRHGREMYVNEAR